MTQSLEDLEELDDLRHYSKKEQIEAIKGLYQNQTSWVAKESIRGGGEFVRSGFSKAHFPLELIQNADDEEATTMLFEHDRAQEQLRIFDDGDGFDLEGVVSVCQQGQSRKESDKQIGFMGIGFKSLFEVCDQVEIHSNGYHFKFDTREEKEHDEEVPGFLLPHWMEDQSIPQPQFLDEHSRNEYETAIIGHVSSDVDIRPALEPNNLSPSVFLFLDNLETVRIQSDTDELDRTLGGGVADQYNDAIDTARTLYKNKIENEIELDTPVEVRDIHHDGETQSYVLFRNIWEPEDVERPQFREDLERSELFVAFQLDQSKEMIRDAEGTIRISPVHSYLPVKQFEDIKVDFVLHADFDLTLNREDVQRNSPWNNEIVEELQQKVLIPVAETIAEHDRWHQHLELVVPNENRMEVEGLIHENLLAEFADKLASTNLLRVSKTEGQQFVSPDEATIASEDVIELFSSETIHDTTEQWPVLPVQRPVLERLDKKEPLDVPDLLSDLSTETLEEYDLEWFKQMYLRIAKSERPSEEDSEEEVLESNWSIDEETKVAFKNNIVLTEMMTLKSGTARHKGRKWCGPRIQPLNGYKSIKDDVQSLTEHSLINSDLFNGEERTLLWKLFSELGAEELTTAELLAEAAASDNLAAVDAPQIVQAYASDDSVDENTAQWLDSLTLQGRAGERLIDEIQKNPSPKKVAEAGKQWARDSWNSLSNNDRRETLQYLKLDENADTEAFGDISLPQKSGGWANPSELLFPKEYHPEHDYEALQEEYDDVLRSRTSGFVDPALIGDDDPIEWRNFLKDLGVCDEDAKKDLSGVIGEEFTRRELEKGGYDIVDDNRDGRNVGKDFVDSKDNYYEIKSTMRKHQKIGIEGKQFDELDKSRDEDYEYIVIAVENSLDIGEIAIRDVSTASDIMKQQQGVEYDPTNTSKSDPL
ncbi:MAG: sacsin N-terminal ATP-binding-like domain-containing protein [Candidatus Nanohaloarchaea archaeon]